VATRDDVGTSKALCLKKHFSMIYPECQIDAKVQLYDASSEAEILSGQPDFVLDCIDNIDTKVTNTSIQTSTFIFSIYATPYFMLPPPSFLYW
jgi:tRNA A37 threonylcarbamoyladenosine dehydratase